ncbi:hypothetical protein ACXZ65_13690 [Streptomyces aculeolatus]
MSESSAVRDQVLVVNAPKRGREVVDDPSTAADVFLGDWSPYRGRATSKLDFDPDRIAAIVGCFQGRTLAVFDAVPNAQGATWSWRQSPNYPGRRIRFHGAPSARFAAQVGADAPAHWRQGEMWPVKVVTLSDLIEGDAIVAETETGRRVILGSTVITADLGGNIIVTLPAGRTVTVRTTDVQP